MGCARREERDVIELTENYYRGTKYYLETRFMFAFVLIGLFFAVCALFLGLIALCSRIGSFLSSGLCSIALFFQTLTAALMTFVFPPLESTLYPQSHH